MNASRLLLLAAGLAVAALAQPASPQPGPALQRLKIRHGDWAYVMEFLETPVWTAGKITGTATTRPTLDGFGAETTFLEPTPGGARQRTETNWLDPETNDISYVVLGNDGRVEQGTCVFTGNTWTWQGVLPAGGRYWKVRGKGSFADDHNSFTQVGEISPDGNMWIPAFTRTATRAPAPVVPSSEADEAALVALEHEWANAFLNRDTQTLERIAADDWTCTEPTGEVVSKARDLAALGSATPASTRIAKTDLKVRVYGDTAIVTGRQQELGPDASTAFQITDTWRRLDGHWRCHATHRSRIVPPLDNAAVRREVLETVQGMIAAKERLDATASWARHADVPDYLWTNIDGTLHSFTETRKIWTDFLAGCVQLKYTTKREEVEVLGPDTALSLWHGATTITTTDGKTTQHDSWTACYLYRRIAGEWRIVGGQESSAPPPTAAPPPPAPEIPLPTPPPATAPSVPTEPPPALPAAEAPAAAMPETPAAPPTTVPAIPPNIPPVAILAPPPSAPEALTTPLVPAGAEAPATLPSAPVDAPRLP
ncbi:MAG: DUF4440 domain-containing protein [Opitutaceae bacterium]|nr:DUF4440 domain-containing protein [Opitutaceae bacterium]